MSVRKSMINELGGDQVRYVTSTLFAVVLCEYFVTIP